MPSRRTRVQGGLAIALASLLIPAGLAPAAEETTFFPLASAARAVSMTAGPDGNLWFGGSRYFTDFIDEIGRITPNGEVTEFPLPNRSPRESGVPAIVTGPDGNLWFTESGANKIGRITTGGEITEFPLPGTDNRPTGITAGPDGNVWFTESGTSKIGRITPTGTITEFSLPVGREPAGIVTGPEGNLWFTERGANRIGRITTSGELTEFPLPDPDSRPIWITVAPDGNLWFTDEAPNQIGRITPAGAITQFPVAAGSGTGAIAAGPAGDIWFTTGREIGSISPTGQTARPACLDAGCGLPPISLAVAADGNLWFGAGTRITGGGGGTMILATHAPGVVGKFFPPPPAVAIGRNARPVVRRLTDLRLSCDGGAAGAECGGVLRLTKRIRGSFPHARDARTLLLAQRQFRLVSGESKRVPLRLTRQAMRLLRAHDGRISARAIATVDGRVETRPGVVLRKRTDP